MELNDNHKQILKLCADDETGLWLIVKRICGDEYCWNTIPDLLRKEVMNTIHDLLSHGYIEAGNFEKTESEKHKWISIALSADETINLIEQEWNLLEKNPDIGDICWFIATDSGTKLAKEL